MFFVLSIVNLQELITRYTEDDPDAILMASAQHISIEEYLWGNLIFSAEEGTISENWDDLYTNEELSFLFRTLRPAR